MLVWTEGAGWKKGGSLAWWLYDSQRNPFGERGVEDGVYRPTNIHLQGISAFLLVKVGNFNRVQEFSERGCGISRSPVAGSYGKWQLNGEIARRLSGTHLALGRDVIGENYGR
jgi:hypothetical protein